MSSRIVPRRLPKVKVKFPLSWAPLLAAARIAWHRRLRAALPRMLAAWRARICRAATLGCRIPARWLRRWGIPLSAFARGVRLSAGQASAYVSALGRLLGAAFLEGLK